MTWPHLANVAIIIDRYRLVAKTTKRRQRPEPNGTSMMEIFCKNS